MKPSRPARTTAARQRRRRHIAWALLGFASGLALLSAASAAHADDAAVVVVENPRFAREGGMYRQYCGACHGVGGMGDGVVAPLMDPQPINLTEIKANFKGSFPRYLVVLTVDGRDTVRAHGESAMPVWGEVFAEELLQDPAARAKARGKVMEIVDYIESIQR